MSTFWGSFKATLKRIWDGFTRWILGPGAALIVVAGALLLILFGAQNVQVGGILDKLLKRGKKPGQGGKAVDVANTVPKKRVDSEGKVIPPGTPDSKGMTQAVVVPIKKPGLFKRPDKVEIVPPGEDKPVEVDLPDGVKAKDVEAVVIVKPDVKVVSVKSHSGVSGSDLDDLISKYGG
jgi:hypothetical protein